MTSAAVPPGVKLNEVGTLVAPEGITIVIVEFETVVVP